VQGRPVVYTMVLASGGNSKKPIEGILSLGEMSLIMPDAEQPGRSGEVRIAVG
jgi:hypothetical protein